MNEARFETPNIIDWKSFTDDEQIKAELKNLSRQKIAEIIARTNGPTIPDETAPKDAPIWPAIKEANDKLAIEQEIKEFIFSTGFPGKKEDIHISVSNAVIKGENGEMNGEVMSPITGKPIWF